jgi:DNA-binding NtrC family response regulator
MIPVIIVSGEAGGQTKEHCKQLGAAAYFEKPIDFEALRACLQQIAKPRRHIPRSEVWVRLRVALKLRGTDSQGKQLDETATTEDVSLSGFLCCCTAELATDSIVEVFLNSNGENYVGKARIAHSSSKNAPLWHYGCRFIEKAGPWVLQ